MRSNKSNTREKILKAAQTLFAQKGFYKTTTLEIAATAGVAEGSLFKHFTTKENLLFALVDEINTEKITALLQLATNCEAKPALREFLKKHLDLINNNFNLLKIILYEAQYIQPLRDKFIEEVALNIFAPLENFIKEKSSSGDFKNLSPEITARAFVGMIIAFIAWEDVLKADHYQSFDKIEVIEQVLEIFLSGVKR